MKHWTGKKPAAQGDIMIFKIDSFPEKINKEKPEKGSYIITHSESGHHHVIKERPNVSLFTTDDPMVSYLEVLEASDATETLLEHLRSYDTHETIVIPPGKYEIRRQREYTPEGWRRVED